MIKVSFKIMIWFSGSTIQMLIAASGKLQSIHCQLAVSQFCKRAIIRNRSQGYLPVNLESLFHIITSHKSRGYQMNCRLSTTVTIMANKANQYVGILLAVEIWVRTFSLYLTLLAKSFTFQTKYILKIYQVDV